MISFINPASTSSPLPRTRESRSERSRSAFWQRNLRRMKAYVSFSTSE